MRFALLQFFYLFFFFWLNKIAPNLYIEVPPNTEALRRYYLFLAVLDGFDKKNIEISKSASNH